MTTTTEAKSAKAAALAARGYVAAVKPGRCALCDQTIAQGQYIGKMPASWNPNSPRRWAHYKCIDKLREQIREKAARLGIVVPTGRGAADG